MASFKNITIVKPFPFSNFQLDFGLPVPRYLLTTGVSDGDWIYLAGGLEIVNRNINAFQKLNINTGEVIHLKDIQSTSGICFLIKY